MKNRDRRRGFTLLELILASSIMAMLSLSLYACLNVAFKARKQADEQLRVPRQAAVTLDLISSDFASLAKPGSVLGGAFYGQGGGAGLSASDTVSFVTLGHDETLADNPSSNGPRKVTFGLRNDGLVSVLVRQVQRNLLGSTLPTVEEEILSQNISGFAVRYYNDGAWSTEWDSDQTGGLPAAVEITIEIPTPTPTDPRHAYFSSRLIPLPTGGVTTTTGVLQ